MAERKKSIQKKERWNVDRSSKIWTDYYKISDDPEESEKVTKNVMKLVGEGKSRKVMIDWFRGIGNVDKVYWSLQGMNNRIVPISMTLKTGEKMMLYNVDRKGNNLSVTGDESLSYIAVEDGDNFWNEESWLVIKDSDISTLPGYKEFAETHIDDEGCKHVSWKDVDHVIWESLSSVDPRDIFLKDGTRLTKMLSGFERTCRFEDDADRYVLHLNLDTAKDFPCYKEAVDRFTKDVKNGDLEFEYPDGPHISRLFTREYMEKTGYIPNIVKKTEDGRYVVVCRLSDLTEAGQKRFTSKGGKPDDKGNIKMCLSHDILVGETARHIEMDVVDGKVKIDDLYCKKNSDVKYYNELVYAAADVVHYDITGAKPKTCFLEDGWKDRFNEWFNKNNPFFGSVTNKNGIDDFASEFPELYKVMQQHEEDSRRKKQEAQGIEM